MFDIIYCDLTQLTSQTHCANNFLVVTLLARSCASVCLSSEECLSFVFIWFWPSYLESLLNYCFFWCVIHGFVEGPEYLWWLFFASYLLLISFPCCFFEHFLIKVLPFHCFNLVFSYPKVCYSLVQSLFLIIQVCFLQAGGLSSLFSQAFIICLFLHTRLLYPVIWPTRLLPAFASRSLISLFVLPDFVFARCVQFGYISFVSCGALFN